MCILFLCSDDPVEGDPFGHFHQTFKVSMMDACCAEPAACLCNCICMPCVQYGLRYKVLKGNMDDVSRLAWLVRLLCVLFLDSTFAAKGMCARTAPAAVSLARWERRFR